MKLTHPNRTIVEVWENETVYEDYVLFEVGLWRIRVIEPKSVHALGEIYTTAPLLAHPSLIYALGPNSSGFTEFVVFEEQKET